MIRKDDFDAAKKLGSWKQKMIHGWNKIQIVSTDIFDSANKAFPLGQKLCPKIVLDIGELSPGDIGIEMVLIAKRKHEDDPVKLISTHDLNMASSDKCHVTFECKIPVTQSGVYEYGFRLYPKNSLLAHRQDFPLMRWI